MHIRVRAPELSAALSMVRNWIMTSALRGLLHHLEQPPGLVARQRAARGDGHEVALAAAPVLGVREEPGGAADVLAVGRMAHQALDLDRDRLLHLACHHAPRERARAARLRPPGCLLRLR